MITLSKSLKICLSCGKKYKQRSIRQKYCGSRIKKVGCSFFIKKQASLEYIRKNKDKMRAIYKIWQIKNCPKKEKITRNKEELLVMSQNRNKRYYYKHREKILKRQIERNEYKRKNNVEYRMLINMRLRLWIALKGKKKKDNTLKMIGCTLTELKQYIQDKFQDGMSWDNYGKNGWTIDHKYPLSKFDLCSFEEQEIAFHYTNLQPLWALDNIKKGNKIV